MLKRFPRSKPSTSVLAWSAWRRMLLLLPVLTALWLAVLWATVEVVPQ
jgi:hypothetical protein